MSPVDRTLTAIVMQMQKLAKRFKRNGVCKTVPSENMRRLWELHPDLDREAIRNEQRGQLG